MGGINPSKPVTTSVATPPEPTRSTGAGNAVQTQIQAGFRQNDNYAENPSKPAASGPIAGRAPTAAELRGLGLPQDGVLATTSSGQQVGVGSDPGNYYCERAFYTSTQKANERGTSIVTNDRGEPLTGFIHIAGRDGPGEGFKPDPITTGQQTNYNMADRQRTVADVVGRGIRGFAEDAQQARPGEQPIRVLVTGYGEFNTQDSDLSRRIVNNPTGEFVRHQSNIDMAMQSAYGDRLVGTGTPVKDQPGAYQYQIRDPAAPDDPKKYQTIQVQGREFAVNETAANGGGTSIQQAIDGFKPHAVISLGVNGSKWRHEVEHHADNGGFTGNGSNLQESRRTPASHAFDENYSLARAINRVSTTQASEARPQS